MAMNCGVGRSHGSDPELLWLWCRPAATALIRPLAWEPTYAVDAALKRQKKQKTKNKINKKKPQWVKEEMKKEFKKYLKTSDNKNRTI